MAKQSATAQGSKSAPLWFAIGFLGFLMFQFLTILPGEAQGKRCVLDGRTYPPGTIKGPYICAPDGSWQRRK